MIVCIFSFNRGRFLDNCLQSIEQCLPQAEILVFDDESDDADTLAVLARARQHHTVVLPRQKGDIKHGGLYHNMQQALERLRDQSLVCFLQDDTQVVRPVFERELTLWQSLFDEDPQLGFIQPCFLRGRERHRRPYAPDREPDSPLLYRDDRGQSAGRHYSDLLITRPARLLERGWHFEQSEPANDRQARALFGPMPYLRSPFAMWLPSVPAYRGKQKTWALKRAEVKMRCGFYPFRLWSEGKSEAFLNRAPERLPVAEDFLTCVDRTPPAPWAYNPLTGQRWLKHLNNLELWWRR